MILQKCLPEAGRLEAEDPKYFKISPEKVSNRNHHVICFKDTVVKAWSGLYKIEGSDELMRIAFDCGLGAKNSQGFGMIEKYVPGI